MRISFKILPPLKELWKPLEFRRLEGMIMAHFNWNIFIPTPTHYVDLLEPQIVFPTDLIHGRLIAKEIYPEVVERLMEFVHYFLDISMQVCTVWTINDCQKKPL